MLKFDVITLFPELIAKHLEFLPFKKAIQNGLIEVNIVNLRDFALDERGTVDDKPYGGGTGMILMIEPIYKALEFLSATDSDLQTEKKRVVVTSPRGKTYIQSLAREFADQEKIVLICGRYEGIDARVEKNLATDVVSIGNYVLSGGEVPALAIMESVVRLLPGVLEKEDAAVKESFSDKGSSVAEHPQYTRPADFMGWKVPDVLLGGNHKEIEEWKLATQQG